MHRADLVGALVERRSTSRWHHRLVLAVVGALVAATLIGGGPGARPASAAPIGTVTNHGRLVDGPEGIALGPDGNLWFTNRTGNSIGRITPAGVVTDFTGTGISGPEGIAAGPDGNLWFTNYTNNSIGRITPAGVVSNFTNPGGLVNGPRGIAAGPQNSMWFTNYGGNSIGQITTTGVIIVYPAGNFGAASGPYGIAAGPDGNVYFTNSTDDSIGRLNLNVDPPNFSHLLGAGNQIDGPLGITAGPDGAMWFTNSGDTYSIGRITVSGVVSNFNGVGNQINGPSGITTGPDGNLWFTNWNSDSIGRITTAGVIDAFFHVTVSSPRGIVAGPDGKLWFANSQNDSIGRSTTAGAIDAVNGTLIRRPYGITKGPDGNLWFANSNSASISRITPAGVLTSFTAPGIVRPYGITAGPDGNLWFADYDGNKIGRITPAGAVTMYVDATIDHPHGITAGPDGALWFTNAISSSIGRITTTGAVTNFTAASISAPAQITTGPDGRLWFTNRNNSSIGAITTAGVISNYTGAVGEIAGPYGIAKGADGKLWFTNPNNNTVSRMTVAGVVDGHFADAGIALPYDLAAGPDGNLWFTNFNGPSVGRISTAGVVTTFYGLGIGQPYGMAAGPDGGMWFTNMANNSIGRVTAANVPAAPTNVTGVRGNAQVAVSWTAPADTGGAMITGYTVTSSPGAKTCSTGGGLTCTVTGLTNGTPYTFTVKATNAVGTGPASTASAAVTPATTPGAPTGASAIAGNTQASVSWVAPASNGGSPITGYTVTSAPGAKTCTTAGALTCTVTGLTNGTPYTFTVKATNAVGAGPASGATTPVTPTVSVPGAPTGVVAVAGKQQATVSWSAPASNGGSPITGYTVTSAPGAKTCTTAGALTCAVTGLTAGTAYTFTVTASNAIGPGAASAASAAVVPWDGAGYHAVTPTRILDSRSPSTGFTGKVVDTASRSLQVTGLGGASNVPANATAVVMNVTVAEATNESFLTVYPTGSPKPNASNLNFGAGQIIPNLVTVKLGTGGKVEFANAVGATHVIADVVGYYDDGTGPGDRFTGITPVRLLDSRTLNGGWSGPLPAGAPRDLAVRQPANGLGVPGTATAVVANVTVTGGTAQSFVSVWPSGEPQPNVSNLNLLPGQTIPNLVMVKIGTNGAIKIANAVGSVQVIVDVVGYFDPTTGSRFHALNPNRILDTRFGTGLSGPQGAGQTRALAVAGAAGTNVPAGATGLVANVTVADGTAESFVSVFPGNVPRPDPFSNLNFATNQVIPNLTAVGIAPNGSVNLYNHLGSTALIADAVGYYAPT